MGNPVASASETRALYAARALLPLGWTNDVRIVIAGASIARVEMGAKAHDGDERVACALPGMPNLHSHAFQRGMAGLTEKRGSGVDSFWTWRQLMYRFVAQMTPECLEAISAQAYVEMLESGFTHVGEFHYVHHDTSGQPYSNLAEMGERIAAASQESGIGLTLLPVFYAHGGFGGAAAHDGQRRFLNDIDRYARLIEASRAAVRNLDGALVGVAPHSLRAATLDELVNVQSLAASAPIHIHIAEQTREVEECIAWCGARPVEWLLNSVSVDKRWCLVHATHVRPEEMQRIIASKAVVGLCPITEANLGDGIFPATALREAAGRYGIGSDSNVLISMTEELRLLEYGQRLSLRTRNAMASTEESTGQRLFDDALAGGAQALGLVPGIEAGASADIVSLNPHAAAFAHRAGDDLTSSWIFAGGSGCIDSVWRAGRKVVIAGRHVAHDRVLERYRTTLERLLRS